MKLPKLTSKDMRYENKYAREAFSYYAAQRQAGNIPPAWRGCRRTAGATTHYAQKSRAVSKFSQ